MFDHESAPLFVPMRLCRTRQEANHKRKGKSHQDAVKRLLRQVRKAKSLYGVGAAAPATA